MNKKIRTFVVSVLLVIAVFSVYRMISNRIEKKRYREWVENLETSAAENVQILTDTISVNYLHKKRTLAIYLPENYAVDTVKYPVVYFLDGQSLFDQKVQRGTEWQVDETLDSLGRLNKEQSIIVGIYNSKDRLKEYKPFPSTGRNADRAFSGDRHAEWIAKSLKPWIDEKYRTKRGANSTFIGGASLGGLMSYYMLMKYPDVFGGAIAFSPSFWVNERVFHLHEKNGNLSGQKIYFNAGERETRTIESLRKLQDILVKDGLPEENIRVQIEEGEGHNHETGRKGFRKAYPWMVNNQ
jgi:predicted alpha/beta superfamily hydrolase